MELLNIGAQVRASVESTAGRDFEILEQFTAEVTSPGSGSGRIPRVPCYLAKDRTGREYVLVENEFGRLVSSHHRTISMLREVETLDGRLVDGGVAARVDAALQAAP